MRRAALVAIALVVASCSGSGSTTTTTAAPPPTATTTTQPPPTTTLPSTTSTTTTTAPPVTLGPLPLFTDLAAADFPDNPATVDDLPEPLTALIDAPIPDPDLTLTAEGDEERWLGEWLTWAAAVQANPADGAGALDLGLLPGTEIIEEWQAALAGRVDRGERFLGYPFIPTAVVLASYDDDFAEGKIFTLVVDASSPYPGYTIDADGTVVDVLAAQDFTVPLELTLRPDGGGEWLVSGLAPVTG